MALRRGTMTTRRAWPRCSRRVGCPRWRASSPTRRAAASTDPTLASSGACRHRPPAHRCGPCSSHSACAASPPTTPSPMRSSSITPTAVPSRASLPPRILAEQLVPVPEPLAVALRPRAAGQAPARAVAGRAARALLDRPAASTTEKAEAWPPWLAPHQVPAAERLSAILARHGGALLAYALGFGNAYVTLAIALAQAKPLVLFVPDLLAPQLRSRLDHFGVRAPNITNQ